MVGGDVAGSSRRCDECKRRRKKACLKTMKNDFGCHLLTSNSVIYKSPSAFAVARVVSDAVVRASQLYSSTPVQTLSFAIHRG